LAGDATQALLPAESEEAGRQERGEQRRQGPAPAQRPRRPALRAPAERVEDDPGHDLVGGLLLGGTAERADRARRQPVRDRVQEHPAERHGETEEERESLAGGPSEDDARRIRSGQVALRGADQLQLLPVGPDAQPQYRPP